MRLASKVTEMSAPCVAQRRPTPPSALRRADSSRPLCVRVLDSTGEYELDCSCFRRNVQESFLDLLENKSKGCLLAGSTYRHPILSSPALPRCSAVRRPDPTRPWCVRVLDSTGFGFDR